STIARLSDANIAYYINKEMYQEANITSQLPALYTIENIAREIRTQLDKEKM
ncbi:RpiR family transcriptional regulator, partial [Vibrio parahaemolyticus]